ERARAVRRQCVVDLVRLLGEVDVHRHLRLGGGAVGGEDHLPRGAVQAVRRGVHRDHRILRVRLRQRGEVGDRAPGRLAVERRRAAWGGGGAGGRGGARGGGGGRRPRRGVRGGAVVQVEEGAGGGAAGAQHLGEREQRPGGAARGAGGGGDLVRPLLPPLEER